MNRPEPDAAQKVGASPVLVTGAIRSGTTWTGKMLCESRELAYINEPFRIDRRPSWTLGVFRHNAEYICGDNESEFQEAIARLLTLRYPLARNVRAIRTVREAAMLGRQVQTSVVHRIRKSRPLIKDPFAIFSAEWMANRFDTKVVVMIRHPAGFVSSLKRLGWGKGFRYLAQQDLLLRDQLGPYKGEIRAYAEAGEGLDVIDAAIVKWNCWHHVIQNYRERHPDWLFVRHEDLSRDPLKGFRSLYESLGLTWSGAVEREIRRSSASTNPKEVSTATSPHTIARDSVAAAETWRTRLTKHEIERVRAGVADVAKFFYSEDEWSLSASGR